MWVSFVVFLFFVVFLSNHRSRGYYELVEELGCHDTEFRLTCGPLDATIAILEATFSQNDTFLSPLHTSCGQPGQLPNPNVWLIYDVNDAGNPRNIRNITNKAQEINFRHAINRRCSGVNFCSFMLYGDYAPALNWGPGSVYLRYACMDDMHITKSCNAMLTTEVEGFVQTPGYPRFYVGGRACHWTFQAPPPQQVQITFLDISLRGVAPLEKNCLDWLIVTEHGLDLMVTCGDILGNQVVRSAGQVLNVTFTTASKRLFPKRGVLFHYKAIGCPYLNKPADGYLVYKNDTTATYSCCVGFVFPDTLTRNRTLYCYNENTWDNDLPDCVNESAIVNKDLLSITGIGNLTFSIGAQAIEVVNDNMNDIIIPSLVIGVLLLGNTFIILYIMHLRKKQASRQDSIELYLSSPEESHQRQERPEM